LYKGEAFFLFLLRHRLKAATEDEFLVSTGRKFHSLIAEGRNDELYICVLESTCLVGLVVLGYQIREIVWSNSIVHFKE
jgi:hypothetical protein